MLPVLTLYHGTSNADVELATEDELALCSQALIENPPFAMAPLAKPRMQREDATVTTKIQKMRNGIESPVATRYG